MIERETSQWLGDKLCNDWKRNFAMIERETSQWLGEKLQNYCKRIFTMIGRETSQWLEEKLCNDWEIMFGSQYYIFAVKIKISKLNNIDAFIIKSYAISISYVTTLSDINVPVM